MSSYSTAWTECRAVAAKRLSAAGSYRHDHRWRGGWFCRMFWSFSCVSRPLRWPYVGLVPVGKYLLPLVRELLSDLLVAPMLRRPRILLRAAGIGCRFCLDCVSHHYLFEKMRRRPALHPVRQRTTGRTAHKPAAQVEHAGEGCVLFVRSKSWPFLRRAISHRGVANIGRRNVSAIRRPVR
jgi:hypothetical protein